MSHPTPPSEINIGPFRGPKACVTCARAKIRCDYEPGNPICKRCRRLKKVCTGQTPGAHRRCNKVARVSSDVARLEQKFEGVAAILAASERIGGPSLLSQLSMSNPSFLSPIACVQQVIKDDAEAALILDTFQTDMSPYFPFVPLPPGQTLDELRQLKPFLFMIIMTIGCRHDIPRQTALARKARELISHKMLINGEQNLDLLQGLLLFIAWYHVQAYLGSQLTNLTHLAMASMTDLGLNKPVSPRYRPALGVMSYFGVPDRQISSADRTLEERRAYLGVLYVTTLVSIWARDMDPMKYSMYADECCRVLEEAQEYPSDERLVILMRIMGTVGRTRSTFSPEEWDPSAGISVPVGVCVKSLADELEPLKARLPTGTSLAETFLSIHYSFAEVFLYGVAVHDGITTVADRRKYDAFAMTRVKLLFTCLDVVQQFFEKFYTLPSDVCFNIPYFTWSLMGSVSVVLSKLCIFAGDGWDPNFARSTFDFPAMVDKMQVKLGEAVDAAEQSMHRAPGDPVTTLPISVPELFKLFERRMRQWKDFHMHKVDQASVPTSSTANDDAPVIPTTAGDDDFLNGWGDNLFDILDNTNYWPQFV